MGNQVDASVVLRSSGLVALRPHPFIQPDMGAKNQYFSISLAAQMWDFVPEKSGRILEGVDATKRTGAAQ
jgi:hypothetical protein